MKTRNLIYSCCVTGLSLLLGGCAADEEFLANQGLHQIAAYGAANSGEMSSQQAGQMYLQSTLQDVQRYNDREDRLREQARKDALTGAIIQGLLE
jgi:hypothetical protein